MTVIELTDLKTTINWLLDNGDFKDTETAYNIAMNSVNILEEQLSIPLVSESTFLEEYVMLVKGNYLHKDGSIKKADVMKDHLGNEYFMVAKDKLYSR